jgi:hypothetical protein
MLTTIQSFVADANEGPHAAHPCPALAEPELTVAYDAKCNPAAVTTTVSLNNFLLRLEQPQFTEIFKFMGVKNDLDFTDLLRWDVGDRNSWFINFVTRKRLDPFQLQALLLEFERIPSQVHKARFNLQDFYHRIQETGLSPVLRSLGIKGEREIKKIMKWDVSTRDPWFQSYELSKKISLFQLEVLRQLFERLEL